MEIFSKFEDALKKYDEANCLEKEYFTENGKYIYNMHLAISDNSLDGDIYNVYLYTYDGCGLEFLPGMDPEKIYGKNTNDYRVKYEHIVNRLLEETDFDSCPIELVLSPMFNGRETVYRIVDTELIL